jgi:hypothetical protein
MFLQKAGESWAMEEGMTPFQYTNRKIKIKNKNKKMSPLRGFFSHK